MQFIYRIEDSKGNGCYYGHTDSKKMRKLLDFDNSMRHPLPINDTGIKRLSKENEIHGFKDIDQALKWFNAIEISSLYKIGFKLVYRRVKEITAIGESQVLAKPL